MINKDTKIETIIEILRYWLDYNIKHITPVKSEILACVGNLLDEVEKQDKMIDYMAEIIEKDDDICDEILTDECSLECKECIKEIVRKRVEEDGKE